MGKANFTEEFKRDAVAQITEWSYPVAEVAKLLRSASIRSDIVTPKPHEDRVFDSAIF